MHGVSKRLLVVALFAVLSLLPVGMLPRRALAQEPLPAAAAPGNLLVNGSFEEGTYGPSQNPNGWIHPTPFASAHFSWDKKYAVDGGKSVRISASVPDDAFWTQTVTVKPQTIYHLTGWIKTENVVFTPGPENQMVIGANLSVLHNLSRSVGVLGSTNWKYVTLEFNSENNSQVTIAARLGYWSGIVTGTAWFDDLRLEEFTSDQLVNGNFEQGPDKRGTTPTGWTHLGIRTSTRATWDDKVSIKGKKSVRLTSTEPDDAGWIQTISVKPHTLYRLTGWIKTENVARSAEPVQAGANLSLLGTWTYTPGIQGTQDWKRVILDFNTEDRSQITIMARLGYWSGTTTGTAWFDDLRLKEFSPAEDLPREAETGVLTGAFVVGNDAQASGGQFIYAPPGSGDFWEVVNNPSRATYNIAIDTAGPYRLKGWFYAPDGKTNSFLVQIDGKSGNGYLWSIHENTAYEADYLTEQGQPLTLWLKEGTHTITFFLREDGTRLDRFELEPMN